MQWIGEAAADARYALRTLRRAPLFSGVAIAIMALGIGANVAIFSVVNALILRPLRLSEAERLVIVREDDAECGLRVEPAPRANYLDWRDAVPGEVRVPMGGSGRVGVGALGRRGAHERDVSQSALDVGDRPSS
jgi:hypothetical protein